ESPKMTPFKSAQVLLPRFRNLRVKQRPGALDGSIVPRLLDQIHLGGVEIAPRFGQSLLRSTERPISLRQSLSGPNERLLSACGWPEEAGDPRQEREH